MTEVTKRINRFGQETNVGQRRTQHRTEMVEQAEQLAERARRSRNPAGAFARVVRILIRDASPTAASAIRHALRDLDQVSADPVDTPASAAVRRVSSTAPRMGASSVPTAVRASIEPAAESTRGQRSGLRLAPPSSSATGTEIRSRARQRILDEKVLVSAEVSALLGSESTNARQYAMELRKRGELLGVKVRNRHLYPAFQFDTRRRTILDVVKRVDRILGADRDPWGALSWWVSPNARVPGHRKPKELLTDPKQHGVLVKLAEATTRDSG